MRILWHLLIKGEPLLRFFLFLLRFSLTAALLGACRSYQVSSLEIEKQQLAEKGYVEQAPDPAAEHALYQVIPRHRKQIKSGDIFHLAMWSFFGNDDDGIFGEQPSSNYKTELKPGVKRALSWGLRNPLHNFTFYVIGSADKPPGKKHVLLALGRNKPRLFNQPDTEQYVFYEKDLSLLLVSHGGRPFFSFSLPFLQGYIGWRERGNFGLSLKPKPPPPKSKKVVANASPSPKSPS